VIRIVDSESSYEVARHAKGVFYNPPTTAGFCAPEVHERAPDPRADVSRARRLSGIDMAGEILAVSGWCLGDRGLKETRAQIDCLE